MTMSPKNHPNTAPKTNYGPKTPAGIGHDRARIVNVNLRKQNTIRLNATAGKFHLALFARGSGENIWFIIFQSPCLMYVTA